MQNLLYPYLSQFIIFILHHRSDRMFGSSPKCIRKKKSEADSEESEKHYLVNILIKKASPVTFQDLLKIDYSR